MNINRIIISGNLVANPTLRETNSGTPVASVTIANNEFFNDGEGERQQVTTFVDVTVWGKSGESFASLAKRVKRLSSKVNCAITIGKPQMVRSIPSTS
jgi:single stranded DNA-binding protein